MSKRDLSCGITLVTRFEYNFLVTIEHTSISAEILELTRIEIQDWMIPYDME